MLPKQRFSKEHAFLKIKQFCAYQERCHREVRDKLYSYGLFKNDVESLLSELIENNILSEERFATQFVSGKFRIKKWGRKKIQFELQQKGVSVFNINAALAMIDNNEYQQTLKKLALAKWHGLAGENIFSRQSKTNNYLLHKGFETQLVRQAINNLRAEGAHI